jgi:hypothetical protein
LSITYSRLLRGICIDYNAIKFFRGIVFYSNIYINKSCLWSVMGLIGILIGWFLGIIKCIKEWLANKVVILKA